MIIVPNIIRRGLIINTLATDNFLIKVFIRKL